MLFVSVFVSGLPICALVLSPVVFRLSLATHKYVDVKVLVRGMLTVPPLQVVALVTLVIVGVGIIVTVTVCGVPVQPSGVDVGVTVYITV